ncbi:hypothetical protein FQZ97_819460 [compost metagenome]
MSSKVNGNKSAESEFRDAFERLKCNQPSKILPGSLVTQNNVAREAGKDPSAFKKARYPSLIREIQLWIEQHGQVAPPSPRQKTLASRRANRDLKEKLKICRDQRDELSSMLVEAHSKILELTQENMRLKTLLPKSNVLVAKILPDGES